MVRVLVVDDASFMRLAIKIILKNNGFEIIGEAVDGVDAIDKYMKLKPDIVTMDITMPKMLGIEALKAILKYDNDAQIVMVSAMGQESIVKEAIISGAKTFIVKPFKEEHVVETLNKVLSMRKK